MTYASTTRPAAPALLIAAFAHTAATEPAMRTRHATAAPATAEGAPEGPLLTAGTEGATEMKIALPAQAIAVPVRAQCALRQRATEPAGMRCHP